MKKIDITIKVLLILAFLHSIYVVCIALGFGFQSVTNKTIINALIILIICVLYFKKFPTLISVSLAICVYFFLNYVLLADMSIPSFFYWSLRYLFKFGFDMSQIINLIMCFVWVGLIILPIVQCIKIKRSRAE